MALGRDPRNENTAATQEARARNPLALGLVIIGSLAMAVATFLPFDEPVGFHRVEDNTLMQNGSGWILLVLALLIAAAGYRVSQSHADKWWLPLIFCAVAAVLVIWMGNDKDLRTLYPVGLNGTVDTSQPGIVANLGIAIYTSQPGIVANLGIAIYLAGVGVAAAAIGSLMFRQNTPRTRTVGDDER